MNNDSGKQNDEFGHQATVASKATTSAEPFGFELRLLLGLLFFDGLEIDRPRPLAFWAGSYAGGDRVQVCLLEVEACPHLVHRWTLSHCLSPSGPVIEGSSQSPYINRLLHRSLLLARHFSQLQAHCQLALDRGDHLLNLGDLCLNQDHFQAPCVPQIDAQQ